MSIAQRKELYEASAKRGGVSKMAIIGINDYDTNGDHAEAIINTNREISQGFALEITQEGATLQRGQDRHYRGVESDLAHWAVNHRAGYYVNELTHTNGMASFWSMLKRSHTGTFHKLSPRHLDRYVQEFAGRHNVRLLASRCYYSPQQSGLSLPIGSQALNRIGMYGLL